MNEQRYKELLFEAIYGQSVSVIDDNIKEEVLNETSKVFQEKVYNEYKRLYPENAQYDIYFIQKLKESKEPELNIDYDKLHEITSKLGRIKQKLFLELTHKNN
jgi:hypothetical protein